MNNQETRTKTIHAPNIVDDIHTPDNSAPASPGQLYQKEKTIKKRPSQRHREGGTTEDNSVGGQQECVLHRASNAVPQTPRFTQGRTWGDPRNNGV